MGQDVIAAQTEIAGAERHPHCAGRINQPGLAIKPNEDMAPQIAQLSWGALPFQVSLMCKKTQRQLRHPAGAPKSAGLGARC